MSTTTQKKLILASMLKEFDYLFCSDCVSKRFANENGKTVTINLECGTSYNEEDVHWEVIVDGKQEVVGTSKRDEFVDDFLKVNEEKNFI